MSDLSCHRGRAADKCGREASATPGIVDRRWRGLGQETRDDSISRIDPGDGRVYGRRSRSDVGQASRPGRRACGSWTGTPSRGSIPRTNRAGPRRSRSGSNELAGDRGRRRLGLGHGRGRRGSWSGASSPARSPIARSIDVGVRGRPTSRSGRGPSGRRTTPTAPSRGSTRARTAVTSRRSGSDAVAGARRRRPAPRGSARSPARRGTGRCRRRPAPRSRRAAGRRTCSIASDLPLQGPDGADPRAVARGDPACASRCALVPGRQVHGSACRSCDALDCADRRRREPRRCAANANAYGRAKRPRGRDRSLQLRTAPRSSSRSSTGPPAGPVADRSVPRTPAPG